MKKSLILFALLTLSAGLWAIDGVKYIDANGQEQPADNVTEVTNTEVSATLNAGWYIVEGTNVQTRTLVCSGAVHIILADGAKLTATGVDDTPGIQVSGEGNSLAIYAQSTLASVGQLFAIGGMFAAGIGGGDSQPGNNITINGGKVTANGGTNGGAGIGGGYEGSGSNITINGGKITAIGSHGAGIGGGFYGEGSHITINGGSVTATGEGDNGGAGIGGGEQGYGSYITINGGTVTARGGEHAAGIGGGEKGSGSNITILAGTVTANGGTNGGAGIGGGSGGFGSNIKVATTLIVKADNNNPPTTEIATTRTATTDIASDLAGKRYATVAPSLAELKAAAIAEIQTAGQGIQNTEMNNWINGAITDINAAGTDTEEKVDNIKTQILSMIQLFQDGKTEGYDTGYTAGDAAGYARGLEEGKAAGLAEAAAALPTDPEGTAGHAVVITKGDKSVTLINPESVSYIKK